MTPRSSLAFQPVGCLCEAVRDAHHPYWCEIDCAVLHGISAVAVLGSHLLPPSGMQPQLFLVMLVQRLVHGSRKGHSDVTLAGRSRRCNVHRDLLSLCEKVRTAAILARTPQHEPANPPQPAPGTIAYTAYCTDINTVLLSY